MTATLLVSLLSVGMLYALRGGLSTLGRTNNRIVEHRKAIGGARALNQMLRGLFPVWADCHGGNPREIQGSRILFQGDPQAMRFVTAYSLNEAHRGAPRIAELRVIPGAEGRGFRLIVNERLYTGRLGAGDLCSAQAYAPIEARPDSFILADQLASCRFLSRRALTVEPWEVWEEFWPFNAPAFFPSAIRIEMRPLEPDPGRLQPFTITAPVPIQRDMRITYAD
jgi:hypothetical protein